MGVRERCDSYLLFMAINAAIEKKSEFPFLRKTRYKDLSNRRIRERAVRKNKKKAAIGTRRRAMISPT